MIVFGASGHGKVIIELLEINDISDITVWDDADKPDIWNYPVEKPSLDQPGSDTSMVIAIGNNSTRKAVANKYAQQVSFFTPVHPAAVISHRVTIGKGTVVMAGVTINTDTTIGEHCIINTSASIDHDCRLDDFVHISPNATLCGDVTVGEGTHIGAGSVVIQGIRIGRWTTIGAGTVVIKDVPDFATVVGNPGRIIKG
ncbi:MAG: acetyltransferase [Flavipsychrobacter sp.]|jgi:acetyltransferase EpsM|nr:acetyltransferase [Flavipsychrobacter sp.]